jgi:hypothetical protein
MLRGLRIARAIVHSVALFRVRRPKRAIVLRCRRTDAGVASDEHVSARSNHTSGRPTTTGLRPTQRPTYLAYPPTGAPRA